MTKEKPVVARPYTFKLLERQRDGLKAISQRTGTAIAEQLRRAVDLWLDKQGAGR